MEVEFNFQKDRDSILSILNSCFCQDSKKSDTDYEITYEDMMTKYTFVSSNTKNTGTSKSTTQTAKSEELFIDFDENFDVEKYIEQNEGNSNNPNNKDTSNVNSSNQQIPTQPSNNKKAELEQNVIKEIGKIQDFSFDDEGKSICGSTSLKTRVFNIEKIKKLELLEKCYTRYDIIMRKIKASALRTVVTSNIKKIEQNSKYIKQIKDILNRLRLKIVRSPSKQFNLQVLEMTLAEVINNYGLNDFEPSLSLENIFAEKSKILLNKTMNQVLIEFRNSTDLDELVNSERIKYDSSYANCIRKLSNDYHQFLSIKKIDNYFFD